MTNSAAMGSSDGELTPENKPWTDTRKSKEERISLLLSEMTIEEKFGQLGSIWLGFNERQPDLGEVHNVDNVPVINEVSQPVEWEDVARDGLGHITRVFGTKPISVKDGVAKLIEYQTKLIRETRLGIPAIIHEECLTGFTTLGATVFPTPLGLATSFNADLIQRVSAAIGRDMKSVGVHQGLSPVLDVVRDYRWGRVEETFGEDPYLVSIASTAFVQGLESEGIVSTLKHFLGHSASRGARNHGPVSMGLRELYDFLLPPFEMAIRIGKSRSVMNSYTDVDGVPVASDPKMLTSILRDELGFEGTVVSDYWAISFLELMHQVAGSPAEAGALALIAGINVELPSTRCYGDELIAQTKAGKFDIAIVDRSVRRVLEQKLELGLLDATWTPEQDISADLETKNLDSEENRAIALDAARESVVLLLNEEKLLPLRSLYKNIVVVGPCADDGAAFLGCYSFSNHVLGMVPNAGLGVEVPSIYESIVKAFPESNVNVVAGCPVKDFDLTGIPAAKDAVDLADLAIVVVGDRAGLFGRGTSGEGNDVADLKLPGAQAELLDVCLSSSTPVIVISVSGRPYSFSNVAGRARAMLQAFMPGEEGGTAIAEVIKGSINPSGRLAVEIPLTPSGQPSTYLHSKYGQPGLGISPVDSIPLFTFGHGLTYSEFEYSDFSISAETVDTDGEFEVEVSIKNLSSRAGAEVVQLYFSDPVAQVARPLIQLLGYSKVNLEAGEKKKITFLVHADRLAYHGREGSRIIDPGEIRIHVGRSSSAIEYTTSISLIGKIRVVPSNRQLVTPTKESLVTTTI